MMRERDNTIVELEAARGEIDIISTQNGARSRELWEARGEPVNAAKGRMQRSGRRPQQLEKRRHSYRRQMRRYISWRKQDDLRRQLETASFVLRGRKSGLGDGIYIYQTI